LSHWPDQRIAGPPERAGDRPHRNRCHFSHSCPPTRAALRGTSMAWMQARWMDIGNVARCANSDGGADPLPRRVCRHVLPAQRFASCGTSQKNAGHPAAVRKASQCCQISNPLPQQHSVLECLDLARNVVCCETAIHLELGAKRTLSGGALNTSLMTLTGPDRGRLQRRRQYW
jgi:hypothetical protein